MPISDYLHGLRQKVGTDLILMPAVTVICCDSAQRVLLARHLSPPGWALPGGSMDPGEVPADTAVREMWEETGLLVEPIRILGVYSGPEFMTTYPHGDQICSVDIVFECRAVGGDLQVDGEEVDELAFVGQTELSALDLPAWTQIVLTNFFATDRAAIHFQLPTWQP